MSTIEERRCANCGHQLSTCPSCKQSLEKKKGTYTPDGDLMGKVTQRPKRGKVNPIPPR